MVLTITNYHKEMGDLEVTEQGSHGHGSKRPWEKLQQNKVTRHSVTLPLLTGRARLESAVTRGPQLA